MSAAVLAEWALFLALSAVAIAGAAMMLLTMSMYRAGLFLMVSFLALAGMFFLLQADLLAVIQVMMNVGGMMIMILFMVMLMIDPGGEMMWDMKRQMKLPGPGAFSMSMPRGGPPKPDSHTGEMAHGPPGGTPSGSAYTCPMHPEIVSPSPGSCPRCGMDLVPTGNAVPARASAEYSCPMHPEVVSTEPGKCPKCGMDLVHQTVVGESNDAVRDVDGTPSAADVFSCPMHPEVRSDGPGKCPRCGMDLVPEREAKSSSAAGAAQYTCPMHPDVVSPEPGSCPVCGMALVEAPVPVQAAPDQGAHAHPTAPGGYTCPMHPEVRSDGPGKCPKCGMDLIPVAAEAQSGTDAPGEYTCPMHPEVRSDGPGKCPKCGMDLIPLAAEAQPGTDAPGEYTCSMHPEVRSDGPGKCPKCGMDLVPAGPAEGTASGSGAAGETSEMTHAMDPAAHHKMMVDMAMSTEQLPWALGVGLLTAAALTLLVLWTPWPVAPVRGLVGDATPAVGELLLGRYMMAFEGAAMLILAGIAGGVILGRREGAPAATRSRDPAGGASVHPADEGEAMQRHTPHQATDSGPSNGSGSVWTCPMHPEVRSDGPGKCPKCGMDLVPAESLNPPGGAHGG